jgi:DNA-binding transcriptional ArsR family regulator
MQPTIRPTARKVLAIVEKHPGRNCNQLMLHISGLTQPTVRQALRDLADAGLIRRELQLDGHQTIFATTQAAPERLKGPTKNIWVDYVPPKPIVTRPDAFEHEAAQSRRGADLVPHTKPLGMCVGALADHRNHSAVTLRPESPLNRVQTGRRKPLGVGRVPS